MVDNLVSLVIASSVKFSYSVENDGEMSYPPPGPPLPCGQPLQQSPDRGYPRAIEARLDEVYNDDSNMDNRVEAIEKRLSVLYNQEAGGGSKKGQEVQKEEEGQEIR